MTTRSVAHLPAGVIGNGSLLATLSRRGEIERLFWPHVDRGQHLGELRLGVVAGERTRWLDEEPFVHMQSYVDDAVILRTRAVDAELDVELVDLVLAERPVLARIVRPRKAGCRLVVYCRPELHESSRYGAAEALSGGRLVFYNNDVALALGVVRQARAVCGSTRGGEGSDVFATACTGRPEGEDIASGAVDGVLVCDLPEEAVLLAAFGRSREHALAELDSMLPVRGDALVRARATHDRERLGSAAPPEAADVGVAPLYRRSLLTFDVVADRDTGGVIAAPEMDREFERSGGYGFVWARDLAFCTLAFLASDREDLARRALRWLRAAQGRQGFWSQRHWTNGAVAPSWCRHQMDETGAALFVFEASFRELADEALDQELWPAAKRAARFLAAFTDPRTGLPGATHDLWEESEAEHAYTAAAVGAGLSAAAAMAERHEPAEAERFSLAGEEIRAAVERELWLEERGHYGRAFTTGANGDREAIDTGVDASLLGLAWPFAVAAPHSPRMRSTVAAIEEKLLRPHGGLARYEGDTYAGGNAWILTTLWLGLWYRQVGDEEGLARCVAFAQSHQTELGLLPEQVADDGRPAWVVPLTWSHAMLVLAVRPELTLIRERTRSHEAAAAVQQA